MLTSRIAPAGPTGDEVLHWRFRVELDRTGGRENTTDTVVLTWDISTIPPEYRTALLIDHNSLISNVQPNNVVVNMGRTNQYSFTVPSGVQSFTRDLTIMVTRSQVQAMPLVQDLNIISLTIDPPNRNWQEVFKESEQLLSDPDAVARIGVGDISIWFTSATLPLEQRFAGIFPIDFLPPPFVARDMIPGLGHLVFLSFNDAIAIIRGTPLPDLGDNSRSS